MSRGEAESRECGKVCLIASWALLTLVSLAFSSTSSAAEPVSIGSLTLSPSKLKVVGQIGQYRGERVRIQVRRGGGWRSLSRAKAAGRKGRFSVGAKLRSAQFEFRVVARRPGSKPRRSPAMMLTRLSKSTLRLKVEKLSPGKRLLPGHGLVSSDGRHQLIMQAGDGNLVIYDGANARWSTGAKGAGAWAGMQGDGNFVVYNKAKVAAWDSATPDFPGAHLRLQTDGNLVVYQGSRPLWSFGQGYLGARLLPGSRNTLGPGQYLRSVNRRYQLIMQRSDGNLVLYDNGKAVWHTHAMGAGTRAIMQGDGNFVLYNDRAPKWDAQTAGFEGAELTLQNDGNLVIYRQGLPIWSYGQGYMGNRLLPGQTLGPGARLRSPNRRFSLEMQRGDGNLVLYEGGKALWNTGASGAGTWAIMQGDGNFVTYGNGAARWHSVTGGYGGSRLLVQNDGNLVIYQGATAIWDRNRGKLVGGGTASTPAALVAADWAARQMNQIAISSEAKQILPTMRDKNWSGNCIGLVVAAWKKAGVSVKYADAKVVYQHYKGSLKQGLPPRGAIVFWPDVSSWGHVAISDGSGGVYTTKGEPGGAKPNKHATNYRTEYSKPPAGWLMPG